jgi:hypothetical protein
MTTSDYIALLHPVLAIFFVFPLIGMVSNFAWQTRQRRVQTAADGKSKIPPVVGPSHVRLGRWLGSSVVGVALIGLAYAIFSKILKNQTWTSEPLRVGFVVAIFVATIVSLVFLLMASQKLWRGVFATLTGMGLILLGCQPEVFRRGFEWYVSHYYYGIAAALLMIFSLAIAHDIYQDRSNRWRTIHVVLNCVALLLFLGQAFTGTRDLLEIPLSWQEEHIYKCDFTNLTCPTSQIIPHTPPIG